MSIIPYPTDTYTDLTVKYYETGCKYLYNSINKDLICNGKIEPSVCCENAISRIYNELYNLNQCYNINNTHVKFICNEKTEHNEDMDRIFVFILIGFPILCICCAYICASYDLCNHKNKNEKQYLFVNTNPTYNT